MYAFLSAMVRILTMQHALALRISKLYRPVQYSHTWMGPRAVHGRARRHSGVWTLLTMHLGTRIARVGPQGHTVAPRDDESRIAW